MPTSGVTFSSGEQAHHIVQSRDPRAAKARETLEKHDIPINGIENGVPLPKDLHQKTGLQRSKTIEEINDLIERADKKGGKAGVLMQLKELAELERGGTAGTSPFGIPLN